MKRIKKPISILLVFMMIVSLFAVVPITASAAVGDFVPETEYLTFTAEEAGSSVTLNYANGTLKYNINNSVWVDYTKGEQITLKNAGDSVRFRGKDTTFNENNHVSIGGKVACSGNVMSLRLDDTGKVQGLSNGCFEYMFNGCTGLTAAPKLPETTLATSCYDSMFYGCKSLTTAPELPAKMLESYCYSSMFSGCESLTTAPALPATTLAVRCYNNMFSGCISLTTAPELPAPTLADYCYYSMFYGCESLTTAPELPATTLVNNCYSSMFNGCESIKLSTTQTAEYSIPYSVPSGGNGTATATNALNNMFAHTGGTFKGKPTINTTYYMYVPKSTVTYKTATWNGSEVVIDSADTNDYTVVTSETASWSNGTYVVDADVTITSRIGVGGNVNLILCDGATLTATQGIHVSRGNTLNIFAQSFGDSAGALKVTSGGGANAGIGSNSYENCGNITINGGNLQVVGGNMSAGIGGGNLRAGGTITINAGDVTATGGNPDNVYGNPHGGAGIGGGSNGGGGAGNVAIHGGHVKATATGNNSPAAVGGGYAKGAEGTVTITDGLVVLAGSNASSAKPCFDYPTHRTIYVEIWEHDHSELSYTTSGNVLTAECSSDGCSFINHEISVKLNTPNKSYDETAYSEAYFSSDSVAHNAAEEFNAATGLNISLDNIEYYQDGTKLSSAPVEVGSYTAKLTVVVNGSEHTISDDFKIIEAHIHDGINFKFWEKTDSLPTTAGNYYLLSDVTLSGTWTVPAGETNLCLAGHTIRQSGSGSVILLNNSNKKLTVYDDGTTGTITGGNTNSEGGGVKITAGTFTLKGGNIEGNVASNGGGVSVSGQSSYFTMAGGTIRYNSGYGNTGGVLLVSTDNFTMTGGEIRYNVGKNFGGIGISNAHPNMSGTSVVKDNVVFNDTSASNTKITKTESGYTIASGGTPCDIKDATANGLKINVTGAFESGAQIGIFNNNQTAEFTSGFDTNNPDGAPADYFFSNDSNRLVMLSANKEAQLVEYFTVIWKNEDGTVLETDEKVAYGTTPEYNGTEPKKESDGVVTFEFIDWTPAVSPVTGDVTYTATYKTVMPDQEHDGIVYKGWASKNSLPTEEGNYYLGYDVTLSDTWTVSNNIRLCLNGNGITKNGGNVITIVGGNLTIDDCGTKTHYFDVNNGKAVNVNNTPGENRKSFTGGYITGGTEQYYNSLFWGEGGGIYLDGGNLILNGGTILGNSATFGGGVGIYSGTMTMNGGTVCYNTGKAGISFHTGDAEHNRGRGASTGYFIMNGGLVANNSSGVTTAGSSYGNDYATYNGGKIANNVNYGVYSNNITIGDIEITGNAYGVGFSNTCSISGNPVITGNTKSNLSINNGKTINTGTLGENAKIGVRMSNPGVFTNGYDDNNTIEPTEIFTADDPTTFLEKNADGEVKLGIYVWTASFNAGGGSGAIDPIEVQKERSFNLPECTFTAPEGKLFLNWSDGTNTYNTGDSYTMTADTEFTAQWIDAIKVSFQANGGSGVMEDVNSYPDYKLPACGFTAPVGKFFLGWLSSADNKVYQTGDTVTLTAETQFTAQWGAEVKYQFDFENGLPNGWKINSGRWYLNANGGDYYSFPAHSGQKNMTYFASDSGTYGELLTSSFDMSKAESATLGFWYTNRSWAGDTDRLSVSYKVGNGEWVQIFTTSGNHESWTKEEITLPSEALAENVSFRFSANGNYGYGIALDDVELNLTGRKLFVGHSVTLGGNIDVNFFINSKITDFANADSAVVKFTWDDGKYNEEVNLKELTPDAKGYYKASVDVAAAQIAHKIHAEVYLNGEKLDPTDDYSVQDYAEAVYNNPAEYDSEKPEQLKALAKALLNYGANAQTVFDSALIEKPTLANANVGNNGYADVTAEQIGAAINGTASDLNAIATQLGAKYFTSSLIYLSKNTLRIYFTPTSYLGEIPNANAYDGSKSDHYYYVDHANIPAAELDDQQTFTVGDTTFTFSALDYAKAVVESTKMGDDQKNLAKSLYLYNQAANDYFG